MPSVAVIGAGAAGCFCVAELRKTVPELSIAVFEAAPKAMAKLSVTGGGRCNLTNSFEGIHSLAEAYPRGERLMKRALKVFSQESVFSYENVSRKSPGSKVRMIALLLRRSEPWKS